MPQLGIQLTALILTIQDGGGNNRKSTRISLLITILSMIFTVISILVSTFEYLLSKQINENGTAIMFKIPFESQMVADMSEKQFCKTFVYAHNRAARYLVSKTIYINKRQVETLIPIQSKDGVIFTFVIVEDKIHFDRMWKEMKTALEKETFIEKIQTIYHITGQCTVSLDKLSKWELESNDNNRQEQEMTTFGSPVGSWYTPLTGSPSPVSPSSFKLNRVRSQSTLW